ncbi:hypothetical protein Fmac_030225 [Flemingia macrophylla]|uniref:Uncharacterized protein n=1 Tax=Flemingia macrophylla TaxID=520843 RepID=A0ABD1LCQ9_9FABA
MCHPGASFVERQGFFVHTRWLVFQLPPRQLHGVATSQQSASVKRCVCSPSQHPGSFRCRLHHADYVWRGRTIK